MLKFSFLRNCVAIVLIYALCGPVSAQTWETFRKDNQRSGVVEQPTTPTRIVPAWNWKAELAPNPAWDGPARWDAYNLINDLPAMRQYDASFYPVSDGQVVVWGSSSQDFVKAVDLTTGKSVWNFVAGGPVRLAPTLYKDKVLFGCDDGFVYCLSKSNGNLVWKFNPSRERGAEQRLLINNDRLISYYPIRTGVVVRDGIVYFGSSLLPWRDSFLCAVNLETGKPDKPGSTFVTQHKDATLEGNLLIAENRLIVPQGRIAPLLFDRDSGKKIGSLPGGGGVTAVVTEEGNVVRAEGGKASRGGQMAVFRGKERVASFPRGRAIVVSGDRFFVLDGQKLFAANRESNELVWSCEVDEPLEIIKIGDAVIVGGRNHITAVSAFDGSVLWSAEVGGRAFGLACAENHLLVSTDEGNLHAFKLINTKLEVATESTAKVPSESEEWKSPPVPRVRKENLLHRWVFHRAAMTREGKRVNDTSLAGVVVDDLASNVGLKLKGSGRISRVRESEKLEAISLSGGYFPHEIESSEGLPDNTISAEAWVRVDVPQQWGGIVGFIQDDGSTEHGWLLGYRQDKFSMAVAGGGNGLTYLSSNEAFESRSWNHVVGTYNGTETRLYVNGSLAASTTSESGPISYSKKCFFTVGGYRDSDENFPLQGALQEVRIYGKALSATEVTGLFEASANEFGVTLGQSKKSAVASQPDDRLPQNFLAWGPYVKFVRPGQIEIEYGTHDRRPSVLDVITESGVQRLKNSKKTKSHSLTVDGLPHKRQIQFQVFDGNGKTANKTESFLVDTHFDWANAQPPTKREAWVSTLVDKAPNPRGLVVLIGNEQKERAEAIAKQTEFHVILAERDEKKAAELRRNWSENPDLIYGKLCVVSQDLGNLPSAFASAVLSSKTDGVAKRLVRPEGGILHDGQSVVWKRGGLKGAGSWSHMYGAADNSAFGGEELSGVSNRQQLTTQWIGRPGPRYQTDRQNRKPSPLAVGGRLFLQGQQRMIALDSYSGAVLWSVESPTVMRWNVPHDCSNWCADNDGVFVAAGHQAWFVEGQSGNILKKFDIPVDEKENRHWGYIARYQDSLIGSVVQASAIYTRWWGASKWFDSTGGDDTHVVGADKLFSMNAETGKLEWQYDGLVLHPTLTILGKRIYFIESKTKAHLNGKTRRLSLDADQVHDMVCLDVVSGKEIWRRRIEPFAGHLSSFYLAGGGDKSIRSLILVASEATEKIFTAKAFDPETGEPFWSTDVAWESNHHGKHISRPAIQGDLVYLRPEVLALKTGETVHRGFPGGHGCSSYTASANGIFTRLGETTWWDARTQKVNRFKRIRTDCWLSVIPAQGMLISAEGGGGCSCGSWLEISLGFLPRNVDEDFPDD